MMIKAISYLKSKVVSIVFDVTIKLYNKVIIIYNPHIYFYNLTLPTTSLLYTFDVSLTHQ